ncbi:hypothetical protein IB642_06570 [Allofrancisella guangzhouensis]|uniref:Uncharacterized protein n=1 Tax=Allofrancisella guangzhouensis TaxID=594679 RepID=A0A0A8E350_9GAMM|nr:hypothetical protein [Allofrancisella guangzhouensis]AJC48443.1 hypothetical protein SD28_01640 [Allofrancisella guangzhouensis]MBK2027656.1 hypothetical protein [Allofrancisella guangzhouensis]MBK2044685.1 hypothetical protein [Allofrancisella guangzhouensis]MBK2046479.1 hypothetical protein [Allofrancisella guangzhouensis]
MGSEEKTIIISFKGTGVNSSRGYTDDADFEVLIGSKRNIEVYSVDGCGQTFKDVLFPDLSKTAEYLSLQLFPEADTQGKIAKRQAKYQKHVDPGKNAKRLFQNEFPKHVSPKLPSLSGEKIEKCKSLVLVGFSRGCFTAILFANELSKKPKGKEILEKTYLFAFDPVPGNLSSCIPYTIASKSNVLKNLPLRFVMYGIGNYVSWKPGFDRYLPPTSTYTEKDVLICTSKDHESVPKWDIFGRYLDGILASDLTVKNSYVVDKELQQKRILVRNLHGEIGIKHHMICNCPIQQLNINPLRLRGNVKFIDLCKLYKLVDNILLNMNSFLTVYPPAKFVSLDKIRRDIYSEINTILKTQTLHTRSYDSIYIKNIFNKIESVSKIARYASNSKDPKSYQIIQSLLEAPMYSDFKNYLSTN